MDYRQAEEYILSFTDYEVLPGIAYTAANYDLRRMEKLLMLLGNPHRETRSIHIAGTKGKGSTAAMITSVLSAAGYRAGLFTSPHLHTIRERVRINDSLITEEEFAARCPLRRAWNRAPECTNRYSASTTLAWQRVATACPRSRGRPRGRFERLRGA